VRGYSVVRVLGYTLPGDGGGGEFVWSPSSAAADDSGITIKPRDATIGRCIRVFSGPIEAKWFGCTGDGVTDDRPSIQLALNHIAGAGGGVLHFGPGNYFINSRTHSPVDLDVGSGTRVCGDGPSATRFTSGVNVVGGSLFAVGQFLPVYRQQSLCRMRQANYGDPQIILASISQFSNFKVGDFIYVQGAKVSPDQPASELNMIISVDGATGKIGLKYPLSKTYRDDGTSPYGARDVQDITGLNTEFDDFSVRCAGDVPFVAYQWFNLTYRNLEVGIKADPSMVHWNSGGVPCWVTGNLRHVVIDNCKVEQINRTYNNEGVYQIANGTVDVRIDGCEFWTDGGPPLQFTESSAQLLLTHSRLLGPGHFVASSSWDMTLDGNLFSLNSPYNPAPGVYIVAEVAIGVAGLTDTHATIANNLMVFPSDQVEAVSLNCTNCEMTGNTIICNNSGGAMASPVIDIGGAFNNGPDPYSKANALGLVMIGNTVVSRNPGNQFALYLSSRSHNVAITGNSFQSNGTGLIRVRDADPQGVGLSFTGNVFIGGGAKPVVFEDLSHEGQYVWKGNNIQGRAPLYSPSTIPSD
jgi:hypothetical protein